MSDLILRKVTPGYCDLNMYYLSKADMLICFLSPALAILYTILALLGRLSNPESRPPAFYDQEPAMASGPALLRPSVRIISNQEKCRCDL